MDERKNITTTARQAIWEAHAKKCAYTGAPIDWSELEIDHIIPLNGDPARKADLQSKGIIGTNFDVNGFENLLPTKRNLNNQKSNFVPNDASVVFFLGLAAKSKEKVERLHSSLLSADQALKGYLQIKTQAQKNDISIDEMILYLRHQSEGDVALRISPEIDGQSITSANSQYAASLMDKLISPVLASPTRLRNFSEL
jgi:HNH endonuclease